MPHRLDKLLLDIRISCEEIIEFCKSKDLDNLRSERMLQLALEREFEIIGEALVRIERIDADKLNLSIPDYRKIIGFRNLVAHGYDLIDDVILWDLAQIMFLIYSRRLKISNSF